MSSKGIVTIIIIIIIIGLGVFFLTQSDNDDLGESATTTSEVNETEEDDDEENTGSNDTSVDPEDEPVVRYTENGFEPATITVDQGEAVRFVNESTDNDMWVASAAHPTHEAYAGTTRGEHCPAEADEAFDQCEPGEEFTFTFEKTGEWNYHNHVNASDTGTVVVE